MYNTTVTLKKDLKHNDVQAGSRVEVVSLPTNRRSDKGGFVHDDGDDEPSGPSEVVLIPSPWLGRKLRLDDDDDEDDLMATTLSLWIKGWGGCDDDDDDEVMVMVVVDNGGGHQPEFSSKASAAVAPNVVECHNPTLAANIIIAEDTIVS
mmetsp:Transcript_28527/g.78353  ORF Transcript_28527/g.78353 Transcript_28527/m.78353 type:complete len:150 (-) Transcript_28527:527-976(-)